MELFKLLEPENYKEHHRYYDAVYVHPKGHIEIYLYRVLFGFRVQSTYTKNWQTIQLDWCCGDDQNVIQNTIWKMMVILLSKDLDDPYSGILPISNIKPYPNDPYFCDWLDEKYIESLRILEIGQK